jgi:hypothetical protein
MFYALPKFAILDLADQSALTLNPRPFHTVLSHFPPEFDSHVSAWIVNLRFTNAYKDPVGVGCVQTNFPGQCLTASLLLQPALFWWLIIAPEGTVALNNCECSFSITELSLTRVTSLDLQAKGQLATLSWVDQLTTNPGDPPMWTSTCKSEPISRSSMTCFTIINALVAGNVIAVGTGTHKHLAKNVAAAKALKSLTEADDQG